MMTALYQMHREKKHGKMEVAENTLIYRFWRSETRYKDIDTCFCMHFPISKERKDLKPGILRNIAFDTYWYEFLGSILIFQKEIVTHFWNALMKNSKMLIQFKNGHYMTI